VGQQTATSTNCLLARLNNPFSRSELVTAHSTMSHFLASLQAAHSATKENQTFLLQSSM
jgi:hypothetical protein